MLEWLRHSWVRATEGGKVWEEREYFTPLVATAGINPKYWMHWHQTQPPFGFTVIRIEVLPIYKKLQKLFLWTTAIFFLGKKKWLLYSLSPFFFPLSLVTSFNNEKGRGNAKTSLSVFEANRYRNEMQRFWSRRHKSGFYCFCLSPRVKKCTVHPILPPQKPLICRAQTCVTE